MIQSRSPRKGDLPTGAAPAVCAGDHIDNGEAKSGSAATSYVVGAAEALECRLRRSARNPRAPFVADAQLDLVALSGSGGSHSSVLYRSESMN